MWHGWNASVHEERGAIYRRRTVADAAGACSSHFTYLKQSEVSARQGFVFCSQIKRINCFVFSMRVAGRSCVSTRASARSEPTPPTSCGRKSRAMAKEITLLHLGLQLQPIRRPSLPLNGSVARSWLQNAKGRRQTALFSKKGRKVLVLFLFGRQAFERQNTQRITLHF